MTTAASIGVPLAKFANGHGSSACTGSSTWTPRRPALFDLLDHLEESEPALGTSERLADFARDHLELDDQARYNLLRYHPVRADICREAIRRYDLALSEADTYAGTSPPYAIAWREEVWRWQSLLIDQLQIEMSELVSYAASVRAGGDPVLVAQVNRIELPDEEGFGRPRPGSRYRGPERAPSFGRPPPERPEPPEASSARTDFPNATVRLDGDDSAPLA